MSTYEVVSTVTRQSLMNKSKADLVHEILNVYIPINTALNGENERLRRELTEAARLLNVSGPLTERIQVLLNERAEAINSNHAAFQKLAVTRRRIHAMEEGLNIARRAIEDYE